MMLRKIRKIHFANLYHAKLRKLKEMDEFLEACSIKS